MVNPHVIRTAEMLDVSCILFVRGKKPTEEILKSAAEHDMVILTTEKTLYTSCGILYNAGLPSCSRNDAK
jgi:serine kinase of HPr protein (carbohydrate metabolism regulator)